MQVILTEKEYQELLNKQYTETRMTNLANEIAERCNIMDPRCIETRIETDIAGFDEETKTTSKYVVIVKKVEDKDNEQHK